MRTRREKLEELEELDEELDLEHELDLEEEGLGLEAPELCLWAINSRIAKMFIEEMRRIIFHSNILGLLLLQFYNSLQNFKLNHHQYHFSNFSSVTMSINNEMTQLSFCYYYVSGSWLQKSGS